LNQSSITPDIVKNLRRGQAVTVGHDSPNIKKGMITRIGQRMTIIMSEMRKT